MCQQSGGATRKGVIVNFKNVGEHVIEMFVFKKNVFEYFVTKSWQNATLYVVQLLAVETV